MLERNWTDVFNAPLPKRENHQSRVDELCREIESLELEAFWKQESRYIHQVMHRLSIATLAETDYQPRPAIFSPSPMLLTLMPTDEVPDNPI